MLVLLHFFVCETAFEVFSVVFLLLPPIHIKVEIFYIAFDPISPLQTLWLQCPYMFGYVSVGSDLDV